MRKRLQQKSLSIHKSAEKYRQLLVNRVNFFSNPGFTSKSNRENNDLCIKSTTSSSNSKNMALILESKLNQKWKQLSHLKHLDMMFLIRIICSSNVLMVFGITSIGGCRLSYVIITFLLYLPEKTERMATNQ